MTATNDTMFTKAWAGLKDVQAGEKYISIEPLLGWDMSVSDTEWTLRDAGIDWLIIGAQTRPTVYPKIEWVQEIVEAADRAGVKVFLKDNFRPLLVVSLAK